MKPIAIIATDDNPDYLFLLPIVCKSWELQGFDLHPLVIADETEPIRLLLDKYLTKGIYAFPADKRIKSKLNPALEVQCIRLYITKSRPDDQYCILSDVDMFIASSFLYRDFDKVNVFGHDLTDFNEVPICYVGMYARKWKEVMKGDMLSDLEKHATPDSDEWHKAWGCDQQILSAKLKLYGFDKINFINRGIDPKNQNLPLGRWDRYGNFKKPSGEIHDVHLMRDPTSEDNFKKIKEICNTIYPQENWDWLDKYKTEFLNEYAGVSK